MDNQRVNKHIRGPLDMLCFGLDKVYSEAVRHTEGCEGACSCGGLFKPARATDYQMDHAEAQEEADRENFIKNRTVMPDGSV